MNATLNGTNRGGPPVVFTPVRSASPCGHMECGAPSPMPRPRGQRSRVSHQPTPGEGPMGEGGASPPRVTKLLKKSQRASFLGCQSQEGGSLCWWSVDSPTPKFLWLVALKWQSPPTPMHPVERREGSPQTAPGHMGGATLWGVCHRVPPLPPLPPAQAPPLLSAAALRPLQCPSAQSSLSTFSCFLRPPCSVVCI